jgi:hypothetical protein
MGSPFRDFIPEGEDTGAQGNGFVDFVPDPVPVAQPEPVVEEKPVESVVEPDVEKPVSKKKGK